MVVEDEGAHARNVDFLNIGQLAVPYNNNPNREAFVAAHHRLHDRKCTISYNMISSSDETEICSTVDAKLGGRLIFFGIVTIIRTSNILWSVTAHTRPLPLAGARRRPSAPACAPVLEVPVRPRQAAAARASWRRKPCAAVGARGGGDVRLFRRRIRGELHCTLSPPSCSTQVCPLLLICSVGPHAPVPKI